ncbi:hypothetical protein P7C73_g2914, partial [Tremellales sp. Uapishka_1]
MVFEYPPSPHTVTPTHHRLHPSRHGSASTSPPQSEPTTPTRRDELVLSSSLDMLAETPASPPSSSTHPSAAASALMNRHTPPLFQPGPPLKYEQPHGSLPAFTLARQRRQSRFDPMADGDDEEDGYGDLGSGHPLRRISDSKEEGGKEREIVSLPGIKALFGAADQRAQQNYLFASPGLPALQSPSASPSSSLASRYSFTSSAPPDYPNAGGWWAPDSFPIPPLSRSRTYPTQPYAVDEEQDIKRRRSDGPPVSRDAEESARLRYQSQSRNASFPNSGPIHSAPLRSLLHPPSAMSSGMSRASLSQGSSGLSTPPVLPERTGSAFAFNRRESSSSSRSPSLQLSHSFADLSASERGPARPEMLPPLSTSRSPVGPDRRPSVLARLSSEDSRVLPPLPNGQGARSRESRAPLTRPPSPEGGSRPRRSSLTELIMANSGDDKAFPSVLQTVPTTGRMPSVSSESGNEGPLLNLSSRRRKREDGEEGSDPVVDGGLDVLARVAETEKRLDDEREDSPTKAGGPKYGCKFCAKTFSRPSSLRIHTYSHTGERPFVCPEPSCQRRFSVQSNLKRHAKVHQMGLPQAGMAAGPSPHLGHPLQTGRPGPSVFQAFPFPPGPTYHPSDHVMGGMQKNEIIPRSEHMERHYRELQNKERGVEDVAIKDELWSEEEEGMDEDDEGDGEGEDELEE